MKPTKQKNEMKVRKKNMEENENKQKIWKTREEKGTEEKNQEE